MGFDAEQFVIGLSARELSELRSLLESEEYSRIIEDWEEGFDLPDED